jgi:hypothetical protein
MTTARNRLTLAASAIALSLAVPLLASAEPQSRIVGTVADFHGKYGLVVRDQRGALAEVTLHPGTVIKPLGLRLERGMKVTIVGQAADRTFAAAEIDAPFEQWPTTRAAALARVPVGGKPDTTALNPRRDPGNSRWSETPDQFSLPPVSAPANPH